MAPKPVPPKPTKKDVAEPQSNAADIPFAYWTGIIGRSGSNYLMQSDSDFFNCAFMHTNGSFYIQAGATIQNTSTNYTSKSNTSMKTFAATASRDATGEEKVHINGNHLQQVNGNQNIEIVADHIQNIAENEDVIIGDSQTIEVTGDRLVNIGGDFSEVVSGSETREIVSGIAKYFNGEFCKGIIGDYWETSLTTELSVTFSMKITAGLSAELVLETAFKDEKKIGAHAEQSFGVKIATGLAPIVDDNCAIDEADNLSYQLKLIVAAKSQESSFLLEDTPKNKKIALLNKKSAASSIKT